MDDAYRKDLAYIHDAGYGDFSRDAAQLLLSEMDASGFQDGTVMDLGCGSGILAAEVSDAGYAAVGIDISDAFIRIARERAPGAEFRVDSFVSADLAPSVAITAIGEVFNYCFDETNGTEARQALFERVYDALVPGGLLLFDMAGPTRLGETNPQRYFREGSDWSIFAEAEINESNNVLTRHITSFRKVGELYRRDTETHRLLLVEPDEILESLRSIGFDAGSTASYGSESLIEGVAVFIARKPMEEAHQP